MFLLNAEISLHSPRTEFSRGNKILFTLVFFLISLLLAFLVVEATLHLFWPKKHLVKQIPYELHQKSNNPKLVYVPRPNGKSRNGHSINSLGFRDYEYSIEKPPHVFRIAVIGDSFTYGMGLSLEDTFPKQLERMLNTYFKTPELSFEVLNMGVMGYDIHQEIEWLKTKVLAFDPDLIIIGYCLNDICTCSSQIVVMKYFPEYPDFWAPRSKFLRSLLNLSEIYKRIKYMKFVAVCKKIWNEKVLDEEKYTPYYTRSGTLKVDPTEPEHLQFLSKIGFMYEDPRRIEGLNKGMAEIYRITSEKNIPAIYVIFPDTQEPFPSYRLRPILKRVVEIMKSNQLEPLDLLPYYEHYDHRELYLPKVAFHPNRVACAIAAYAVIRKLLEDYPQCILQKEGTAASLFQSSSLVDFINAWSAS